MADQIIVVNNTPSVISVTDQPATRLNITNEVSTVNFLLGGLQIEANGIASITGPNATATGLITFTGNGVRQNGTEFNFIGDYSNANIAAYLPTYTGNLVSLTGAVTTTANVTADYLIGNGRFITGILGSDSGTPAIVDFVFSGNTNNGVGSDEIVSYQFSLDWTNNSISRVTGNTWTRRTTVSGFHLAKNESNLVITGSAAGSYFYSNDQGNTWTQETGTGTTNIGYGIAYGNISGTGTWVRVSSGGEIHYAQATDPAGITWTQASDVGALLFMVVYDNNAFVAVGDTAPVYSTDGITWIAASTNIGGMRGLLWDGARWLAVGNNGLWASIDADTWSRVGSLGFGSFPGGINYNGTTNGTYLISGGSTNTIYTCTGDPTVAGNWSSSTITGASLQNGKNFYIGGTWFVMGSGIWRSTNLTNWTQDTTTGRTGVIGQTLIVGNQVVAISSTEAFTNGVISGTANYRLTLPAHDAYAQETLTWTPPVGIPVTSVANDLASAILALRPTYTYENNPDNVARFDTNSSNIVGAWAIETVIPSSSGTVTLTVTDGMAATQDRVVIRDPIDDVDFQFSVPFNMTLSNLVSNIADLETLPGWTAVANTQSNTVTFTSTINQEIPEALLLTANVDKYQSSTLAVDRDIISQGIGGTTEYIDNAVLVSLRHQFDQPSVSPGAIHDYYFLNYDQYVIYDPLSNNITLNIRGSQTALLHPILQTNQSIDVDITVNCGSGAYGITAVQIDSEPVTVAWATPPAGAVNKYQNYIFKIFRISDAEFFVLGSFTDYSL